MKIAFILDNVKEGINYSDPTVPNPGIGGTQFLIWTVSSRLAERDNGIEVYLFAEKSSGFPEYLNVIEQTDILESIKICSELGIDYLILRGPFLKKDVWKAVDKYKVKTIMWSHNFENYISLKNCKTSKYLVKNICVSNEQLDLIRDTDLYKKSTVIFNGIDFSGFDNANYHQERYRVCYIGNLYPQSGYETIIDAWTQIEEKFPQAELLIIGGNNLYDITKMKNAYSRRSFENLKKKEDRAFRDNEGKLKENIKFVGILGGMEKLKVMRSAYVGVANITLAGDTFGLAAIEFQALGVPVVSVKKHGVRETIADGKTGILVDKNTQLATGICEILQNKELHDKYSSEGKKFVRDNFSLDSIVEEWEAFLSNVDDERGIYTRDDLFTYDGKKKILLNAKLRSKGVLQKMPPMLFYKYLIYGARRVLQKLNVI